MIELCDETNVSSSKPKTKPITLEGVIYKSFVAACKKYNVNASTACQRLKYGWTKEQAFGIDESPVEFYHNGKLYKNKAQLAREYGVVPGTFRRRLNSGLTIDEALTKTRLPRREKEIKVDSITFPNFKEAAKFFGINHVTAKTRIDSGWTIKDALKVPPGMKREKRKIKPRYGRIMYGKLEFSGPTSFLRYYSSPDIKECLQQIYDGVDPSTVIAYAVSLLKQVDLIGENNRRTDEHNLPEKCLPVEHIK